MSSVDQKLKAIKKQYCFPFAISKEEWVNGMEGLQVWKCDKDEEGAGVDIHVFCSKKDMDNFDENDFLWAAVESAVFFKVDNDCGFLMMP